MLKFDLIKTGPLNSFSFRWKKWAGLSAIFSVFFLLMLPMKPILTFPDGITIIAVGEKNTKSAASEVWIDKNSSLFLISNKVHIGSGWEVRNGQLLSYQNQPSSIFSNIKFGSDLVLVFLMHPYSGIVDIKSGNVERKYDLYSKESKQLIIKLSDFPGVKIDLKETILKFIVYYLSSLFIFILFSFATCRWGRGAYNFNSTPTVNIKMVIFCSLPSIIIYVFSILVYWPAQMSPDSISQWEQITQGIYNDAHPVLSTLMYSGINHIVSGPQWVVLVMSLLLSLTWGWALSESRNWGVNRYVIWGASILFPMYLPTFLMASTLWKDVPFAIGVLFISVLTSYLIRKDFEFNKKIFTGFIFAGILVFGTRHNGIIIIVPFFLLLLFFVRKKRQRITVLSLLIVQCVLFVLTKTILISALHAGGIGTQYKAIYGLHILGAMENSGVSWNEHDKKIISDILPESVWKQDYQCDTVVPLFWSKYISWEYMASNVKNINELAVKSIIENPLTFIRHQLCVTGMVWRITPNVNEYTALTPMEITEMPSIESLKLRMDSKFPYVKRYINNISESLLMDHSTWIRPAGYLLAGLFLSMLLWFKYGSATVLIFTPAVLNAGSWLLLSGSQDYRYMWPVVLIVFYIILLTTGQATTPLKKERLHWRDECQ